VELLHTTARASVEWMFYCLTEGTLLALFAWILLRLLPRQNSGTRFVLWFSVLLAMVALPFFAGAFFKSNAVQDFSALTASSSRSLFTLSNSVAVGIFAVWTFLASVGLIRVMVGIRQVNRIRKNSQRLDPAALDPAIRESIESFPRTVTLRVSNEVQVPTAIGFFNPAVVIPEWFLQEMAPAELQQVLVHELTHLRRRDDWTNLTQKVIKAILFFHPSVWWLEQRLSLEREMACDEAVLARAASPYGYAQCLTRLAEKTLIRKNIALAQGLVSRMRQLSLRVAQILDDNRPEGTQIWKPAIPMVAVAAALCGLSAWNAPALVSFHDETPAILSSSVGAGESISSVDSVSASLAPAAINAGLRSLAAQPPIAAQPKMVRASVSSARTALKQHARVKKDLPRPLQAKQHQPQGDYVVRTGIVEAERYVIAVAGGPGTGHPLVWQVSMWQVRIPVLLSDHADKTLSRKNI
jgi:beta-lactamase regulating signal transducer with metallopeptidase domain